MILIIALISCATTPAPSQNDFLNLTFPSFPEFIDKEGNSVITLNGEIVTMPLWLFKKITKYKVLVDETEQKYNVYKESVN